MQKQEHVNTFQRGLIQDFDKLQVSNQNYIYSTGGRVVFNEDGTYAWENAKGTKSAFTISADYGTSTAYIPIGSGEINSKLVIFSTNGTNSEIGLVAEEQFGVYTYQTIFNDKYDPNGDLLNFSRKYQMRDFKACVENNKRENTYFNDDYNEPRTFNIVLGLQSVSPQFINGSYQPLLSTGKYPDFYSVHGMSLMIDLTWGKIKYQESINGTLKSGQYQYAYRYIHQSGYASPWSPLSGFVFVTTDAISSNWTQYQMQESNVQTDKGNRLIINNLDTRFQEVEVAALYWVTEAAPDSAYTFFRGTIPSNGIATVEHQGIGATIAVDDLVQRYAEIKKAKTANMKDNTYHLANFETYPVLEIDTSIITVEPIVRPMLSDETTDEPAQIQPDGLSKGPPFTGQIPKNTTVTENLADGLPETYSIVNDYISYKGTQWASIFRGHFGGETYPFALVLFDRKGQPAFAQHITDFTFPQRYGNTWTDARLSGTTTGTTGAVGDFKHTNTAFPSSIYVTDDITTDKWYLNILGLKFSGIDLTDVLYDTNGKLQISGFSIVRTDRIKQIMAQGLVMSACGTEDENGIQQIVPLPTMFNGYLANGAPYSSYSGPDENFVGLNPVNYGGGALPYVDPNLYLNQVYHARPNMGMFESPDYMINNNTLIDFVEGDTLRMVDICVKAYAGAGKSQQAPWNLGYRQYYQKNYRTVLSNYITAYNGTAYNQIVLGDTVDILEFFPNIQSGQAVFGSLFFNTTPPALNYLFWGDLRFLSRQIMPTCLFTCGYSPSTGKSVNYVGVLTDDGAGNVADGHGAYFIANYTRPVGAYTITEPLLESRTYYNVGHFIPINQTIINTITAIPANNGRCIFNNVPVWGGDCYIDYWTYYRLYADLDLVNGTVQDYGIALSFPIESVYNIALRQGNTYDEFGPKPSDTYHNLFSSTWGNDGIYYFDSADNKVEDFNMNIVLSADDTLAQYTPKPSTFLEVYDYPVREQYTGTKIYGEAYDTYRRFPVLNFRDAEGNYGEINSLQFIFNYLYIVQQNGFARVRFNEREAIVGQTGTSLDIASNLGLQGFDYLNTIYGTQHQFSVVNSGKAIYWIDAEKGKAIRFAADGLLAYSDEYGMHNFMSTKSREYWKVKDPNNLIYPSGDKPYYDNPAYAGGIVGVFDFNNQSLYYTFTERLESVNRQLVTVGTPLTLEYSELNNQYKDFSPFTPRIYFRYKQGFLSPDPTNTSRVYVHGEGDRGMVYTGYKNSKVRFVVNPANVVAKWFDNGSIALNNQTASGKIYSVTGTVEDMAAQTIVMPTDNRWKYLQGFLKYPLRAYNAATRLRGKSCIVEIEVLNDSANTPVRITSHMTDFRISPKT